jgi:two-component system sensor kinase
MIDCRDNAMLVIVEDNGIGLQPEAVEQDSRRLGLYGIRERAELLGGKFVIESEPGQGTSLFVEIPACQPDESDGQDGHGS